MKRILITGANSYIGTSFEQYISAFGNNYSVDTIDMIDGSWKSSDFSPYDSVFHVAGIAHSDVNEADEETKALYYKVNRDLTIETAKKAKNEGVKQFVFMSSAIIYGKSSKIGQDKLITRQTPPSPENFYGDSKLKAEEGILALNDQNFCVVILRPPMIYGKNSKGNYVTLSKYAKKLPFFPDIENKRSMLYIENLCEFIRLMVENNEQGIFFPQNNEYVKTSEMVKIISELNGKNIKLVRVFNPFLRLFGKKVDLISKVFGNLRYDMEISKYKEPYNVYDFKESLKRTEGI